MFDFYLLISAYLRIGLLEVILGTDCSCDLIYMLDVGNNSIQMEESYESNFDGRIGCRE